MNARPQMTFPPNQLPPVTRAIPSIYDFADFVNRTWKTTDEPWATQLSIAALGLAGESGESVEHVKKYLRDGKELLKVLPGENDPEFIKELGDVLYYVVKLTQLTGVPFEFVIWAVVDKLNKRRLDSGKNEVLLASDVRVAQPPIDNRFVAAGCEPFGTSPASSAAEDPATDEPDESLSFDAILAIIELNAQLSQLKSDSITIGGELHIGVVGTVEDISSRYLRMVDVACALEKELCR